MEAENTEWEKGQIRKQAPS